MYNQRDKAAKSKGLKSQRDIEAIVPRPSEAKRLLVFLKPDLPIQMTD